MIAITSSPKDSTSWHEYYWTLKNSLRSHRIPLCTRWRQRSFGRLSLSCLNHHAYVSDCCSCSCWCWVLCKVGHNFDIIITDSVIPSSLHQAREWKVLWHLQQSRFISTKSSQLSSFVPERPIIFFAVSWNSVLSSYLVLFHSLWHISRTWYF